MTEPYDAETQEAVSEMQAAISEVVLPALGRARSRDQAFVISVAAVTAAMGGAVGAYAALHDLDLAEQDHLALADAIIALMREVRTQ